IERVKSFLAQTISLDTHLERVGSYLPVAEGITSSTSALQECLGEHPVEKLVHCDCSAVLGCLAPLMDRFHRQFEAMRNLEFEPAESLQYMQDAAQVLLRVSTADFIPLPFGTTALSLSEKWNFRQAMVANSLFCELLDMTGPIIERQTEILGYSKRLTALGTGSSALSGESKGHSTDLDRWGVLDTVGQARVTLLSHLSVAQGRAEVLLTKLGGLGDEVATEDIEEAEIERDILTVKLRSRRLSELQRQAFMEQIADIEATVIIMQARVLTRTEVSAELRPYLLFPKVATALSCPRRERVLDTSRDQHPCDWGEGCIVTESGLVEGQQDLVNPYAIVDKTNLDLVSDDFKGQNVTLWDMTGCKVTGCDLTGVEGLTLDHLGSLSSITQCNLSGMSLKSVNLSGVDATGCDFSDADMGACSVSRATLSDCDFSRARLDNVKGLTVEQLVSVRSLHGAVISGVDMRGWTLEEVDLSGADLRGCAMGGARVYEESVVGAMLPQIPDSPTVTPRIPPVFEVAQGVTETVVTPKDVQQGSNHNFNPVILIVPAYTKSWTLRAMGYTHIWGGQRSQRLLYEQSGTVQGTRSGTSITMTGPRGTYTHPCTPGRDSRVRLDVLGHEGESDITLYP
ncbi:hypothetical protein KIPB_003989, partial [Kipferlia bialata]